MASGSIVGECPVCKEWVYEDEWTVTPEGKPFAIIHTSCVQKFDRSKRYLLSLEEKVASLEQVTDAAREFRNASKTGVLEQSLRYEDLCRALDELEATK